MPRAKPKSVRSVLFPTPRTISWSKDVKEKLTDDLCLSLRDPKHKKRCDRMLAALARELENYSAWEEHGKDYPNPSNRLKEFEKALPALEKAFTQLDLLSEAALTDMKNAGRYWEGDGSPHVVDARAECRQAQAVLMNLIVSMRRASTTHATVERRGRTPTTIPSLIARLTIIFDTYYNGGMRRRQEAQTAFLQDAIQFYESTLPPRLK